MFDQRDDRQRAADFARRIRELRDSAPAMSTLEGGEAISHANHELNGAIEILYDFFDGKDVT